MRENFAASRERYTILTSVWSRLPANSTPHVAVLFRGKPGGRIITGIHNNFVCPPWMRIQVQENGSYRCEDCVEALEWMLPDAADPRESIVVMLDWFSAHRTDEVLNLVEQKGHVLLFHGGGVTPFIQVNDTHLHSQVARSLITIENAWAHSQRVRAMAAGLPQTTPPCFGPPSSSSSRRCGRA